MTKEADELALKLMDVVEDVSHPVFLKLNAATAESNAARIRALQLASSPTRKLRNGNGTSDQHEAV